MRSDILIVVFFVFILLIILIMFFLVWYLIALLIGGVNVLPTTRGANKKVIEILNKYWRPRAFFLDLGCGEGGILRLIKKIYPEMMVAGVEVSRIQYINFLIKRFLADSQAKIIRQDLFLADVAQADFIYIYLPRPLLPRLAEKLKREAKPGAIVITNTVSFSDWTPVEAFITNLKHPDFEKMFVYKI